MRRAGSGTGKDKTLCVTKQEYVWGDVYIELLCLGTEVKYGGRWALKRVGLEQAEAAAAVEEAQCPVEGYGDGVGAEDYDAGG